MALAAPRWSFVVQGQIVFRKDSPTSSGSMSPGTRFAAELLVSPECDAGVLLLAPVAGGWKVIAAHLAAALVSVLCGELLLHDTSGTTGDADE